jgi:hypothetical protein
MELVPKKKYQKIINRTCSIRTTGVLSWYCIACRCWVVSPYLKSAQPPMLHDYFDPALREIVIVCPKNRVVRISTQSRANRYSCSVNSAGTRCYSPGDERVVAKCVLIGHLRVDLAAACAHKLCCDKGHGKTELGIKDYWPFCRLASPAIFWAVSRTNLRSRSSIRASK